MSLHGSCCPALHQRTDDQLRPLVCCAMCSHEQKKKAGLLPASTPASATAPSSSISQLSASQEPLVTGQVGSKALAA